VETKILGLSGRKQAGKNSIINWIIGQQMISTGIISYAKINEKGQLVVPRTTEDGGNSEGIFDITSKRGDIQEYLKENVWGFIKPYSFADILKESVIKIFGLSYESAYGTDEQKNIKTKFTWNNFWEFLSDDTKSMVTDKSETLSCRHILQIVGTDIFRRIYGNIWVEACLNKIREDCPELAIIYDCRFINEVEGIENSGGKVLRLLRSPFSGQDEHESEKALDDYKFENILDNRSMNIQEQNKAINELLKKWDFIPWMWKESK
jgi:hypothetical protein